MFVKQIKENIMELKIIDGTFAVCKVNDFSEVDYADEYIFTAKTDEENSLVCFADRVPENVITVDTDWRAFRICGTLDFSLIGILAKISEILAKNKIGIFAVSTYNTDYIFTKSENFDRATDALQKSGYVIS